MHQTPRLPSICICSLLSLLPHEWGLWPTYLPGMIMDYNVTQLSGGAQSQISMRKYALISFTSKYGFFVKSFFHRIVSYQKTEGRINIQILQVASQATMRTAI